ncbi:MAG: serine/threonine protein kinase [Alphaproteobacteria bacterium]|nr:serine/threonine protein kinase [Alphaproteobacteria bacterium]
MSISPGTILDGRYEVEERIAAGGHAEVLRARHVRLGSVHAVKVLHDTTREQRERLLEEGRIQARLVHPNIVRVTDVIDLGAPAGSGGDIALVMDFIEGDSLARWISRTGRPSLAEARRLGEAVLAGVATAHGQGLVHRDLKPHNVLMEPGGIDGPVPRVADFGLAKALAPKPGDVSHTRAGIGMGTPAYMAPEQYIDAASVDQRADVFSLGAVLYELATGHRAFQGDKALDLYQKVMHRRYRPLADAAPDLPPGMIAAIEGALEPDRDKRVPDVRTLLRLWRGEPDAWQAGDLSPAEPPSKATLPPPHTGSRTQSTFAFDGVEPGADPASKGSETLDAFTDIGLAEGAPRDDGPAPTALPEPEPDSPPETLVPTDLPAPPPPGARPAPPPPVARPATSPAPASSPDPAPLPKGRLAAIAGLLLAPALFALLQFTGPLDLWLNSRLLTLVSGELPASRTVLLTIPAFESPRELRARWPDTLARLVDAGVASVTFDLAFSDPDPVDERFAAAVRAADAAGVPVIAAGRWSEGRLLPAGTPALADALRLGLAEVETEGLYRMFLGRIPVHRWHPQDGDSWHIAALTVQAWTPSLQGPLLDEESGLVEVGPTRSPVEGGRLHLHPTEPPVEASVMEPDSWPALRGKAVVIGSMSDRDRFWTRAGIVQGAAIQAAAIETLASGRAPRSGGAVTDAIAALLTGVCGFLLARATRKGWLAPAPLLLALFWAGTRAQAGVVGGLLPLFLAAGAAALAWRLYSTVRSLPPK